MMKFVDELRKKSGSYKTSGLAARLDMPAAPSCSS